MTDNRSKRIEDEPSTTPQTSSPPLSERVSYADLRSRFGRRVGVLSEDDIGFFFEANKSDFRPIEEIVPYTENLTSN